MDLEIIEFVRPDGEFHSLYITGVALGVNPQQLYEFLEDKCSPFGLIYEIQVIDTNPEPPDAATEDDTSTESVPVPKSYPSSLYAFVKFYSAESALKCKTRLAGRVFLAGQSLKIRSSTRKQTGEPQKLHSSKCYELANYYLGFNGWSISIRMIKQNEEHTKIKPEEVQFVCGVKLHVQAHGLVIEGYGVSAIAHDPKEPETKSIAYCRAKKLSYSEAVQNSFRKLVLVVLPSGKVYAEADSTAEERVYCDEQLTMDDVIKVNDLDQNPLEEDIEDFDDTLDMDLVNQRMLEDLADENA